MREHDSRRIMGPTGLTPREDADSPRAVGGYAAFHPGNDGPDGTRSSSGRRAVEMQQLMFPVAGLIFLTVGPRLDMIRFLP
jgi:hypothetical protein